MALPVFGGFDPFAALDAATDSHNDQPNSADSSACAFTDETLSSCSFSLSDSFEGLTIAPVHVNLRTDEIGRLRFSQESVLEHTNDGISLQELEETIGQNGYDKQYPVRLVEMPDEELTSLDNRRLTVMRRLGDEAPELPAILYAGQEEAPAGLMRGIFRDYQANNNPLPEPPDEIDPDTYAHAVYLRMRVQNSNLPANCYGYEKLPAIRPSSPEN